MRYPLSYVRSRTFPRAALPATVRAFYVVDMAHANDLLARYFPSTGPASNLTVVPFDIEYVGNKRSDRDMRTIGVPVPRSSDHYLRLLTIVRDGVVIVFDLLALGDIPVRVREIFRDPFIIKVGIELKGDSVLLLRHFAVAVYNGWELSNLWKCMHPSIEVAPLTSHISLDDMARIVLGVYVDKEMQTSKWSALFLSVAQINYAILDAYILLPLFRAVVFEYEQRLWSTFTPNAFAFNADLTSNGAVVVPGPATTGGHIHVWGIGTPVPVDASGDWSPTHAVLDAYNGKLFADCRSTAAYRFFAREIGLVSLAVWRMGYFTTYRIDRWLYVHSRALFVYAIVVVPALAVLASIVFTTM
ncbi:ribonuclease H-like domain-containing protein [Schizophyllum commune]